MLNRHQEARAGARNVCVTSRWSQKTKHKTAPGSLWPVMTNQATSHNVCECKRPGTAHRQVFSLLEHPNYLLFKSVAGQSPETSLGDGHGDGDEGSTAKAVVAIKQFKGLADMEDEHIRNYVRLTQEREADLARNLIHPNIVRCLGTLTAREGRGADASSVSGDGDGDGVAFLVFEHVPGTLLDLIQERPGGLSLSEVRMCARWLILRAFGRPGFSCGCNTISLRSFFPRKAFSAASRSNLYFTDTIPTENGVRNKS